MTTNITTIISRLHRSTRATARDARPLGESSAPRPVAGRPAGAPTPRRLLAAALGAALGLTVLAGFGAARAKAAAPTGFSSVPGDQQATAGQGITVSTFTANEPTTFAGLLPRYIWGDGQQSVITRRELGATGPMTQLIGAHTWQWAGTYLVLVSYTDVDGNSFSTSFTVTVSPAVATASAPQAVAGPQGSGFLTIPADFTAKVGQKVNYSAVTLRLVDPNAAAPRFASGDE